MNGALKGIFLYNHRYVFRLRRPVLPCFNFRQRPAFAQELMRRRQHVGPSKIQDTEPGRLGRRVFDQIHPKSGKSSRLEPQQLWPSGHHLELKLGHGSMGETAICQKQSSTSAFPVGMFMRQYCQCDCRRIQMAVVPRSSAACA
ncbi:hypothetical protein PV04_04782 [Phialophora macrospora]|uniref:Uncharacterized protein n=1 Tax=Phialophora macrospora TaxID=1851006 RepID=A0A0D2E3D9_9EURO|nr:hypothetical protein PV04_04782 [Phialophora macrospora]